MKKYCAIACLLLSPYVAAESFVCIEVTANDWTKPLVEASILTESAGVIAVAGTGQFAEYSVQGFNRRWNFGCGSGSCDYSFLMKPNGTALYYDFAAKDVGEVARPSMIFKCRESQ